MKIFNWTTEPEPGRKQLVEAEISKCLDERDEFKPCHTDAMTIELAIIAPSYNRLEGLVKCSCGKEISEFKGDSMASSVEFTVFP